VLAQVLYINKYQKTILENQLASLNSEINLHLKLFMQQHLFGDKEDTHESQLYINELQNEIDRTEFKLNEYN